MTWRAIVQDANLNRAREGLRVLEELARRVLNDQTLWLAFKSMRHQLKTTYPVREVEQDPGATDIFESRSKSQNLFDILNANAARVQEALRVLEECSKERTLYHRLRFEAYQHHQVLFDRIQKHLRIDRLHGIYLIYDSDMAGVDLHQAIDVIAESGISIVQIRKKSGSRQEVAALAKTMKTNLPRHVLLIVNDYLDVALTHADGVHLGKDDFSIETARSIVPASFIIGASANKAFEAQKAALAGATYVAMGCLFPSPTKASATPTRLMEVIEAKSLLNVPLCVIGGIDITNIAGAMRAYPDMIAICSGVWRSQSPVQTLKELNDTFFGQQSGTARLLLQWA